MTTGERLVSISTLSVGSALDHFLNISVGSGEVRVYGTYNLKYKETPKSLISYVRNKPLNLKYVPNKCNLVLKYIETEKSTIKYVKKNKIKITYANDK